MTECEITNRGRDLLDMVKLTDWKEQRVGKFSKGMKQRLAIAQPCCAAALSDNIGRAYVRP